MSNRVLITGVGAFSSNAENCDELYRNSTSGKSGIKESEILKQIKTTSIYAGEIVIDMTQEEKFIYISKKALLEMLDDSGLNKQHISSFGNRFAFSMGASVLSSIYVERQLKQEDKFDFLKTDYNEDVDYNSLNDFIGNKGEFFELNAACASGTMSVGVVYDLIKSGQLDIAVAGGTDVLCDTSIAGFNSMNNVSEKPTKPFDINRSGLNLGEAAAYFVLESEEHAKKRGAKIYGEIFGYASRNDAYHITSPDPNGSGAYECMKKVLSEYQLKESDVLYINAHGTGTVANDKMEVMAIDRLVDENAALSVAYVSSSKSMLGHCLGAAGSIELAICILCLKDGMMPLSISLSDPIPSEHIRFVTGDTPTPKFTICISNSFAFAGNCASIGICRYM